MRLRATGDAVIEKIDVGVYKIPTDAPEADGTCAWDSTTLVVVTIEAGDQVGIGYTYADPSTALLIRDKLAEVVQGANPLYIGQIWTRLVQAIRNVGRPGIASLAISAIDVALWDLKAKLLGVSLASLLGPAREAATIYGSGGFTSYSDRQLQQQLSGWAEQGIKHVKMKIGTHPADDPRRVRLARKAIGPDVDLMVDANGAYRVKQALEQAQRFSDEEVSWFEEPVSSDNLIGLREIRERAPPPMEIAAGEYGFQVGYFRRMLESQAVDVLQADATRCGGITGFLQAAALCEAFEIDLSSHCAPALHLPTCCAATRFRHMEYFHDHARIERLLFDGAQDPHDGTLVPNFNRPGLGLEFRWSDAQQYAVSS
jgi:L-alanine-DL-glutamate epimerase-like enolase superfamily enzyme